MCEFMFHEFRLALSDAQRRAGNPVYRETAAKAVAFASAVDDAAPLVRAVRETEAKSLKRLL